ncbi:2142_t:CDS:1 [Funneliformis mosseae]|uniref:2142_t:CDS:1 n=1 Tax=Funneliformis mosseae TaxID=27381 RepID=A0A9N9DD71_FUNMO|nr:2142_t:CDS:1 [Funneliformis mosseae]
MNIEGTNTDRRMYDIFNLFNFIKKDDFLGAESMEKPLIIVDLGGQKDTGILEGTSPSVKGAYPGRLCSGISVGKHRGAIILLDEFEKVADEGLAMMLGNVLDIKKNKD